MEVHHHSQEHGKRSWKSYFWEFLMLFLAITLGFLVENQREHYVEHQREKTYVRTLYRDLKMDTTFNNSFKKYLLLELKRIDSLISMINERSFKAEAHTFYRLALNTRNIKFYEYHNSTFEQLKNSGNLRLLTNSGLADSLTQYNSTVQDRINNQEERYKQATLNAAVNLWEILDARYFKERFGIFGNEMPEVNIPDNPVFEMIDDQKMKKYKNICFEKKLILPTYFGFLDAANGKATNLILVIKKEYHLQ